MIETQFINPNDYFHHPRDPNGDAGVKRPLLYYALDQRTPYDCFNYLMTLEDLACDVNFFCDEDGIDAIEAPPNVTNVLFYISGLGRLSVLRSILSHSRAPDINSKNQRGYTVLQELCQLDEEWPEFEKNPFEELRLLLE